MTSPTLKIPGRLASLIVLLLPAALLMGMSNPAYAQGDSRTFPETGKTVMGKFLAYWNDHGGLAQQGYPISDEIQERSDTDGNTYTVQYFERAVFELHPENQPPYDVLLSLLGTFEYKKRYPGGAPNQQASTDNPRTFSQTGKTIGGKFRAYWEANGGLAQQGYPLTDEFQEKSALNGQTYRVQYFERAVFEYHPENQPPFDVLLSQLGKFRYQAKYTATPDDWTPKDVWRSGASNWSWENSKPVAGDFNGDGKDDIAVIYKYPGNDTALWIFDLSSGTPKLNKVWDSGAGNWIWEKSTPVVGDFNGDGKDDIGVFYDYGNNDTGLFVFDFNSVTIAPKQVWRSGPNNWGWDRTKPVAGDFNGDRKDDIAVLYKYGSATAALFIFDFSSGNLAQNKAWESQSWSWDNSNPMAADFNGDGKSEVAVLYKYPGEDTALWIFDFSSGSPVASKVWDSGANNWNWDNSKPVAGDFNGDGKASVAVFYNFGSANTWLWLLK